MGEPVSTVARAQATRFVRPEVVELPDVAGPQMAHQVAPHPGDEVRRVNRAHIVARLNHRSRRMAPTSEIVASVPRARFNQLSPPPQPAMRAAIATFAPDSARNTSRRG